MTVLAGGSDRQRVDLATGGTTVIMEAHAGGRHGRRPLAALADRPSCGVGVGSQLRIPGSHALNIGPTLIVDTFAEAFGMRYCRLIVTALDDYWLDAALREFTGYSASVIACDAETGVERLLRRRTRRPMAVQVPP